MSGKTRRTPLLVIVGPTAIGKTRLSLSIAGKFNGEIISADSRLLYRGLDVGTDKPPAEARSRVPHHLIDVCRPDETLTLGQYQQLAYRAIADVGSRGRLPLLVGGTGQYVKAVTEGWGIPRVPPHRRLRNCLAKLGGPELARWLAELDPLAAQRIDPRNMRRVLRALEVTLISGRPISQLQRVHPPDYAMMTIGLTGDRQKLYARVDARIDHMMAHGLLEEVRGLKEAGFDLDLPAMSGLGYRQLLAFLDGEYTLAEAVERIKFETHRFVRQQYTWFRPGDPGIQWYDVWRAGWEEDITFDLEDWLSST